LALVAVTSVAQDSEPVLRTLPPEPAPPPTEDEQADEQPKVTIAPRRGGEIQEYRVNGQLRAIRITPSRGPAYYLLDTDGDGLLETRSFELADDIRIPGWVIFRW
jgi:hypothetical protein